MNEIETFFNSHKSAIGVFSSKGDQLFIEHYVLYECEDPTEFLPELAIELYQSEEFGVKGRMDLEFISFAQGEDYDKFKEFLVTIMEKSDDGTN